MNNKDHPNVEMYENPINCNCSMRWFRVWIETVSSFRIYIMYSDSLMIPYMIYSWNTKIFGLPVTNPREITGNRGLKWILGTSHAEETIICGKKVYSQRYLCIRPVQFLIDICGSDGDK